MAGPHPPDVSGPTVLVSRQNDGTFMVKVRSGRASTSHVVSVPSALAKSVAVNGVNEEQLVRASFAFLLEREPPTAILPKFGLDVIARYFPEYPLELPKLLGQGT